MRRRFALAISVRAQLALAQLLLAELIFAQPILAQPHLPRLTLLAFAALTTLAALPAIPAVATVAAPAPTLGVLLATAAATVCARRPADRLHARLLLRAFALTVLALALLSLTLLPLTLRALTLLALTLRALTLPALALPAWAWLAETLALVRPRAPLLIPLLVTVIAPVAPVALSLLVATRLALAVTTPALTLALALHPLVARWAILAPTIPAVAATRPVAVAVATVRTIPPVAALLRLGTCRRCGQRRRRGRRLRGAEPAEQAAHDPWPFSRRRFRSHGRDWRSRRCDRPWRRYRGRLLGRHRLYRRLLALRTRFLRRGGGLFLGRPLDEVIARRQHPLLVEVVVAQPFHLVVRRLEVDVRDDDHVHLEPRLDGVDVGRASR